MWEYAQDDTVYGVPRDELLDDGYHAHLAKLIRKARPKLDLTEHIRLAGDAALAGDMMSGFAGASGKPRLTKSHSDQPSGSCELAVVDAEGNWVQMMNTLQGSGIPGMVIDGVPMVGSHSTFGALMSPMDATLVRGAKARCIIGNTIVLKGGRPVLSAGSPGNVHCTVPQVLTYALDFKLEPYASVDAPRMLPMTEARAISIEDRLAPGVVEDLHRLMLNELGVIIEDGVLARFTPEHFLVGTSSAGADRIADWLEDRLQCEWPDAKVLTTPVTSGWAVLTLAGPRARDVLAAAGAEVELGPEAFSHMSFREGTLAGIRARFFRVSFTGELSYEINVPWAAASSACEKLMLAGAAFGITPVGVDAWMLLRTEKGYLHVGSDTDGTTVPSIAQSCESQMST